MNAEKNFHFTLGPVQGFVAQARRTRDFWAGSFILSWLAGVAMKAVQEQKGELIVPVPDKNYLAWLEGEEDDKKRPRQGAVPNRFTAIVDSNFKPEEVVESVRQAWRALAETVWDNDLAQHSGQFPATREIWDRQIEGFWEISWVYGEASNLLDRRKNWRTSPTTREPGVKCSVMDGWQELSGVPGPAKPDSLRQKQFWQLLRTLGSKGMTTDLAENEHLCALAFIKRRFARWFHQVTKEMPGGWTLRGWELSTGVPSVMYMAAVHWLEKVIQDETPQRLERLYDAAQQLTQGYGEWHTDIKCIHNAYERRGDRIDRLRRLDGSVFFEHVLENFKLYAERELNQQHVDEMRRALKELTIEPKNPTPFYAILLMDGDSLGSQLSDPDKRGLISAALKRFTDKVSDTVYENNGFLIYAGGDDVMALLPLEDALPCAAALRADYLNAFKEDFTENHSFTLSGAIEYAHVKMPLTRVLSDAHHLLDEVAKDGRGRDAIAVRVWKPGGKALEWAMPWDEALNENDREQVKIVCLANAFAQESRDFSSKFFYKIRARFDLLNPEKEDGAVILQDQDAVKLLAADYLASKAGDRNGKSSLQEAEQRIKPLLKQCRPAFRKIKDGEVKCELGKRLEEDGALLVRFLAHKGVM